MSARNDPGYLRPEEKNLHAHVGVMTEEKFIPQLNEAFKRGIEMFPGKDFYVSNNHMAEPDMPIIKRDHWFPLSQCPTPVTNQIVFRYRHENDTFEIMWSIPPQDGCDYYIEHKDIVVPEEQELLGYVLAFVDGSLEKKAQLLNGEVNDL